MSRLHCDRCRALFSTEEHFMTASIEVVTGAENETLDQLLLCAACADAVGDSLTLGTAEIAHE